jgi:HD superfamily phosphohydrolase
MAVARQACERLITAYPELQAHRPLILCAALLHDIGHGPFSHTGEEVFQTNHEAWTLRILHESPQIRALLDQFSTALVSDLSLVYQKQIEPPLIWQLVSSQLDCDRLDYLMRDSYFTGTAYGNLDLDRILLALNYDPVSRQLVVAQKGLAAIEHYLVVRYFMYAQVYNHPKNIAASWGLERAFARAKTLLPEGNLQADATVTAWLTQSSPQLTLQEYLAGDDTVFTYHLQTWQQGSDNLLSDLCRRFLDRDLLKAMDVSHLAPDQRQDLQKQATLLAEHYGFLPDAYIGLRIARSRGYTLYQRGIKLQTTQGLREISEVSSLVQTLIQPHERALLLYPREIEAKLRLYLT